MLFLSVEDFYKKVKTFERLTREEEKILARKMQEGGCNAKERLVQAYLPMIASHIRHMGPQFQTLGMVMYCYQMLEKLVEKFDFEQENEPFVHRLSWGLRQAVTRYIADK